MQNIFTPRSPVFVNLDITSSCNQHCIFCAVSPNRNYAFKKKEEICGLIDKLYDAGVFEITLFGGEPLLHPEIEEIAKYTNDNGFEINLVTNGTFPNKIKRIAKYLTNASVSIHGFNETHEKITQLQGSYKLAIKSLEEFIKEGVDTAVCYTLIKDNFDELEPFISHIFSNFEVKGIVLDRFIPRGFGKYRKDDLDVGIKKVNAALRNLDKLSRKYKKGITTGDGLPLCFIDEDLRYIVQPCQAGILFCSVTEDGRVKLCPSTEAIIGNIKNTSLKEIWNNRWYLEYRSFEWLPEQCKKCSLITNCYGGCKASSGVEPYSFDVYLKSEKNGKV
jgi:radical SAM protein with 4Fe4S-binding SPASM domain